MHITEFACVKCAVVAAGLVLLLLSVVVVVVLFDLAVAELRLLNGADTSTRKHTQTQMPIRTLITMI